MDKSLQLTFWATLYLFKQIGNLFERIDSLLKQ